MSWEFVETGLETPKWIDNNKWVSYLSIYGKENGIDTINDYLITYDTRTKNYYIDFKDDYDNYVDYMCDIDKDFRDNLETNFVEYK